MFARLALLLASSLLSSAFVAAQTPCISLNDGNNNITTSLSAAGFSGPNAVAYRFTATSSQVLMAAQILTESAFATSGGYQTLEVWDDSGAGLPAARLGGGTWQSQVAYGVAWQGASFDQLVALQAGFDYWLVWREGGANRLPYEPGGVPTPFARWNGSSWILQAAQQPVKFRGFCSLLAGAGVQAVGFGCQSSAGRFPAQFTNYAPTLGNGNFQFEATGFPAGSVGLVVLGTDPLWVSLPIPGAPVGCELHTDLLAYAGCSVGSGTQQASHQNGASGHTLLDLPIPANPALTGMVIGSQFAVLDPGSADPLPFVFSNGLRITLF